MLFLAEHDRQQPDGLRWQHLLSRAGPLIARRMHRGRRCHPASVAGPTGKTGVRAVVVHPVRGTAIPVSLFFPVSRRSS